VRALENLLKLERHAKRLSEIVAVLGKYGLADWLSGVEYEWLQKRLRSRDGERISELTKEARIRMTITELGTTFIKLGQILGTRGDLVGPELARELSRLQEDAPADPPATVRRIVEEELGLAPEDFFEEFDPEPFASASIAQAHNARLNGDFVVVKVQHEGIQEKVRRDLDILAGLAELAEKHSTQLRAYRPVATVSEFKRVLLGELDFTREKRNIGEFQANFLDDETVRFPAVFADASTRRMLTMERLEGISIADADRLRREGCNTNELALRGAQMYLDMIFRDGFYHADPHPGNLLYLPGAVVGVLDCGMVGRVDDELRDAFEDLLLAVIRREADRLTDVIVRLGAVPPGFDREGLRAELSEFVADYGTQAMKDFDISGALKRVVEIVRERQIILPMGCTLLLKTMVMLEGTARQLSPDFSLLEVMKPYQAQVVRRRFSPERILRRLQRTYRDWDHLLDILPRNLADILARVQQGSFDVHLEHRRLDSIVNRLVLGLISTALLVGSTLLWSLDAPPLLFGISVFGVLGYAFASLLVLRLLLAIRRSGNITSRG